MTTEQRKEPLLNINELCEQINISKSTIYKEVKSGKLKVIRMKQGTSKLLFDPYDVVEYLNSKRKI